MFLLRVFIPFFIIFSLIAVDEAVAVSEIRLSSYWTEYIFLMPLILYITQFLFAPYQAGLSDHFCRRKSLIIAMSATLLSFIFIGLGSIYGFMWIIIGCVINGMFGNTIPIARAALLDNDRKKRFRFHLALSICFIAIGSVIPLILNNIFNHKQLYCIILFLSLGSVVISLRYKDIMIGYRKGLQYYNFRNETQALIGIFKKPHFYLAWIGYGIAEMSFYVYYFKFEVLSGSSMFPFVPLSLGVGYLGASLVLFIIKVSDRTLIYIGGIVSIMAAIAFFISDFFFRIPVVFYTIPAIYAGGFAFFIPGLFSIISSTEPIHKQGKIFGLIESSDTAATIFSFFSLRVTKQWPMAGTSLLSLILIIVAFYCFMKICTKHFVNMKNIRDSSN